MKPMFARVVRFSVVYATTGFIGLGVLAWMAYRARRRAADLPPEETPVELITLPLTAMREAPAEAAHASSLARAA